MKATKSLIALAAAMAFVGAAQAVDVSYNLGVVSLYKSSGVDQDTKAVANGDKFSPAVQGGVDFDLGNGFYVGNWNSTGTFGTSSLEVDLYGGYAGELGNGLSYDVGYARYVYPGAADWNGGELVFKVGYAGITAKLTRGVDGSIKNGSRFALSYDYSLNDKVSLNATYGMRNEVSGDYGDYALGASYDLGNSMSVSATFSGATKKADAGDGSRDNRLVVGVSKSF